MGTGLGAWFKVLPYLHPGVRQDIVQAGPIAELSSEEDLWRAFGLTPDQHRQDLPQKRRIIMAAGSLVQNNEHYTAVYWAQVNRLCTKRGYSLNVARRKAMFLVAKLFLSHVWLVWRSLEGLPIQPPHPFREHINHRHYWAVSQFVPFEYPQSLITMEEDLLCLAIKRK